MRMLVKYTAYVDFDIEGNETDRSYYLSFVKKDDVMDIPFKSLEELKSKASKYTIADYINSQEFSEEIKAYEDYKEFFDGVDVLVLYEDSVPVKFNFS